MTEIQLTEMDAHLVAESKQDGNVLEDPVCVRSYQHQVVFVYIMMAVSPADCSRIFQAMDLMGHNSMGSRLAIKMAKPLCVSMAPTSISKEQPISLPPIHLRCPRGSSQIRLHDFMESCPLQGLDRQTGCGILSTMEQLLDKMHKTRLLPIQMHQLH